MTARADALAALIERVEAGALSIPMPTAWADAGAPAGFFPALDVELLDEVARLEAPLRARGWTSVVEGDGHWRAALTPPGAGRDAVGRADGEARARLLAVLRALQLEEAAQ